MKLKFKFTLSNILIIVGTLLVITVGVYEGVTYPWKTQFAQWGLSSVESFDTLPEPTSLPATVKLVPLEESPAELVVESIPSQPNFFATRPPMDITKLGTVKIPRIQISENLVEGTGDELLYGVGHLRSTPMPGGYGNCVLAGHRNYVVMRPFRYLDKMELGDQVYITDDKYTYTYKVFNIFEVTPEDTWVMQGQKEHSNMLTLITCTPVLTYNNRLIVWCDLVDIKANA